MANHKKKREVKSSSLRPETKRGIVSTLLFATGLFITLALFGKAGPGGAYVDNTLFTLLGVGNFIVPLLAFVLSMSLITSLKKSFTIVRSVSAVVFFFSSLATVAVFWETKGGIVGNAIAHFLVGLLDVAGSMLILSVLVLISLIAVFDISIPHLTERLKDMAPLKKRGDGEPTVIDTTADTSSPAPSAKTTPKKEEDDEGEENESSPDEQDEENDADDDEAEDAPPTPVKDRVPPPSLEPWELPSLSLLEKDSGKAGSGDVKANANIIKRTLQNFGIDVEMDEVTIGPSVTQYSLKPAEGVKLSRIAALQDNLSYALAAHPIRIEAPIPGKSLVGIEIPNKTKSMVGLGSLLASPDYQSSEKALLVAVGKGITGNAVFADVAKMPHVLIAGATGSGKSVTIHAIINSLLFRNSPDALRFIMIDPKRVELTLYDGIPHLVSPVIKDAKKTIAALRWAAKEMERRYELLEEHSVQNILSYQSSVYNPALEKFKQEGGGDEAAAKLPSSMPYIVIVIDELADIMHTFPRELEASIVRLAQMSRAVGIHLILSTQRPSVDVITGLIKANVPARIALQVPSLTDSRTILDASGAENLLGAGDMLYQGAEMSKPSRLQSAFISEREVKAVVSYLKKAGADRLNAPVNFEEEMKGKDVIFDATLGDEGGGDSGDGDPLYEQAREIVVQEHKASTSLLQRKLSIGYGRAARIMDILEERGIIGPAVSGSKAREVLLMNDLGRQTGAETPEERASLDRPAPAAPTATEDEGERESV